MTRRRNPKPAAQEPLLCGPRSPFDKQPRYRTGTEAGWQVHLRAGERACPECERQHRARQRVNMAGMRARRRAAKQRSS